MRRVADQRSAFRACRGERGAGGRGARQVAGLLSFPVDDEAVPALAGRLVGWLQSDADVREQAREGIVATVRERWSWDGVARGVIAAALGGWTACKRP